MYSFQYDVYTFILYVYCISLLVFLKLENNNCDILIALHLNIIMIAF